MGNHHSHGSSPKNNEELKSSPDAATSSTKKGISRSSSGADIQDKTPTQLVPVEKLAKILLQKSQEENGVQGITSLTFSRYLFPLYPEFAERLFHYFHRLSKAKTTYIGVTAFKQQCEKFLAMLDEEAIRETYVKMFANDRFNIEETSEVITPVNMRSLLMCAYKLAMDHYSEGPQTCVNIQRTLSAVVESCFHSKHALSVQFVAHWSEAHCPRILFPLHRFAVHTLTTSYRILEAGELPVASGLDLETPVLDQPSPFSKGVKESDRLMPMSQAWLLASALPPMYSRPRTPPNNNGTALSSRSFVAKLLNAVPSHWILLYNSNQHGQGTNRFLHHVLAYRGPTLVLLRNDNSEVFCVACPNEWRDTHLYWGTEEAVILQLLPKFSLIEKGPKMLYLNTSIRGYPQGLRAGSDPRKPIISVDSGFEKIEFKNIPFNLTSIEVWGCGDQASREKQLDVKKWQVKEAERQRQVKLSAADWLDHPDRYLLELAGRTNYNQS